MQQAIITLRGKSKQVILIVFAAFYLPHTSAPSRPLLKVSPTEHCKGPYPVTGHLSSSYHIKLDFVF